MRWQDNEGVWWAEVQYRADHHSSKIDAFRADRVRRNDSDSSGAARWPRPAKLVKRGKFPGPSLVVAGSDRARVAGRALMSGRPLLHWHPACPMGFELPRPGLVVHTACYPLGQEAGRVSRARRTEGCWERSAWYA
jgi:hypothetical protein